MGIRQSLKWVNRHGTATALLVLMLCLSLAAHTLAMKMIELLSDIPLQIWPDRFQRNLTGIQFIHNHACVVLPYLVFFLGLLVYVEIRRTPRSAVWAAFALLSLPLLGYFLTCIRIGCTSIHVLGINTGL